MLPVQVSIQIATALMALGLLLAFVTPWRIAWRVVPVVWIPVLALDQFRPLGAETGDPKIVYWVLIAFSGVAAVLAALRYGVLQISRRVGALRPGEPPEPLELQAASVLERTIAICLGLYLGGHLTIQLAHLFAGQGNGVLIHLALGAFAGVGVWRLLWALRRDGRRLRSLLRLIGVAMAGVVAAACAVGIAYPVYVAASAETAAKRRPYCIWFDRRGREASSLQDFVFLTMDKSMSSLAVKMYVAADDGVHPGFWTYYGGRFEVQQQTIGGPARPPCQPKPGFVNGLPLF